jgi:hypothetical protein
LAAGTPDRRRDRRDEPGRRRRRFLRLLGSSSEASTGLPELRRLDLSAEVDASSTLGGRQVNVKVSQDLYDDLQAAADYYDTTPTAVARLLVARGARTIAEEIDRERFLEPE